jgi:nucleotide-binding universal stress UspA family protein
MKGLFNNIVIAVSGTETSIIAAKYAIVMAKLYRCKLTAVFVVDTATIKQLTLSKIFIQDEAAEYEKALEANGNRYLAFVEELALAKDIKIAKKLRKGAIYTEILSAADEYKADLILLGGLIKSESTGARDIIGHSQREIIANAKCSVMIVKEPDIEQIYKKLK